MSTPLIWVVFPLGFALLLIITRKKPMLSGILASVFCLLLALAALLFPRDLSFLLPDQRLEIASTLELFGRSLQINGNQLTIIGLLYGIAFFWNLGSLLYRPSLWFNILSLGITALWVATLSVNPFLYAAVFIELIALLSVPLLSPRGVRTEHGVLRYLVFQTLALPLILLTGWMLAGIGSAPSANPLIVRSAMLVLFGFALWIGAFPFHSWIPMISAKSHPWVVSLLLTLLQSALSVFLLHFLDQYAWLRNLPVTFASLRWIGVTMIAIAGLFSAVQTNLGKNFGYLVLYETGYSLLAIGLAQSGGLNYLAMLFIPRVLSYALLSLALSALWEKGNAEALAYKAQEGLFKRRPVVSAGILAAFFSLLGLPLLPVFPHKQMLWLLTAQSDPRLLVWVLVGSLGLLLSIARLLRLFAREGSAADEAGPTREKGGLIALMLLILLLMLAMGITTQLLLPRFLDILSPFTQLAPGL
ncbi:MAG TPA: proton-conducting transporter membrane subunit [Anaerolineaceae bacterium]|nr:proton-conducting transporter membrane subunit [Anaerolineaceae bacterium]